MGIGQPGRAGRGKGGRRGYSELCGVEVEAVPLDCQVEVGFGVRGWALLGACSRSPSGGCKALE